MSESILTRRQFLGSAAGTAALGIASRVGAERPSRPNVVMISLDDARPWMGCYGRSPAHTPHIDRLASRGIAFDRAYCQGPTCVVSRSSLFTGLRPNTLGIYSGRPGSFRLDRPDLVTLPQAFAAAGYHTASYGKMLDRKRDDPASWQVHHPKPGNHGEKVTWRYQKRVNQELSSRLRRQQRKKGGWVGRIGPAWEAADAPARDYPDGVTAEAAVEHLRQRSSREPFFLGVGFTQTHLPWTVPKPFWDLYAPDAIALPDASHPPEPVPGLNLYDNHEVRRYTNVPGEGPIPEQTVRSLRHAYLAALSFTDALVGRVLDQLRQQRLLEHTLVVLFSDHGFMLGERGVWGKHNFMEPTLRVPLILAGPGVPAQPRPHSALVELLDVYPTLCDLCRVPAPNHLEGRSFRPLLSQPGAAGKPASTASLRRGKWIGRSIRTDRYLYVEWCRRPWFKRGSRELYDFHRDPRPDRSEDPAYTDIAKELSARLPWDASMAPYAAAPPGAGERQGGGGQPRPSSMQ